MKLLIRISVFFFLLSLPFLTQAGSLKLPKLFTDNMVLQQDYKVNIWGWASPQEKISVAFLNQKKSTTTDANGNWKLELSPLKAGGPFTMTITGTSNDTITIHNILVGEVWVCSGQSNMEMPLAGWGKINNYQMEIAQANYPNIRLFTVPRTISNYPRTDVNSKGWLSCDSTTIPLFSATAYFFGRSLNKKLNVPIGLIHSSYGGTPIESWTSRDGLRRISEFTSRVDAIDTTPIELAAAKKTYEEKKSEWNNNFQNKDPGFQAQAKTWADPSLDISSWSTMQIPNTWENAGLPDWDGSVWFTKDINVPSSWLGKDLSLHLGPLDDYDTTFFNGVPIGGTSTWGNQRIYTIPASLIKEGKNRITSWIIDMGGEGGFFGKPEEIYISSTASSDSSINLSLVGDWKYKQGVDLDILPNPPVSPDSYRVFCCLYNGMIAPLIPYSIRGAIWYQGESNASNAYQYRTLFPNMITNWREHWHQGDFPFYFVQLAGYKKIKPEPVDDIWAELREAQLLTLGLPNTGMASAIDIGNADDIHPKNKQEIGNRLARIARTQLYEEAIEFSGPIYNSMRIDGNKIHLTFTHIDGGLMSGDGTPLKGFAISGTDKKFVWADASIQGDSVIVSCSSITHPVAVRYAWASNPICNLYNISGLPASPFRTDNWPLITQKSKK